MKKLYVTCLVIVLALTMFLPASVASADSGVEVSGEYVITVTKAECMNLGSSCVLMVCLYYTGIYEGELAGTSKECIFCGFNVNGDTTSRVGIQTYSGTVLGKEGTYTAYVLHQSLGNGDFQIEQTIISGTDELAGIQGNLVFTVTETELGVWEGAYSGTISLDS